MERLQNAVEYACRKHRGQLRKGTGLPYIIHPMEVMSILSRMTSDPALLMAGVLHDTVEDTDATLEELAQLFGEETAELVAAHTSPKDGDWWETRQASIEHLKAAPYNVKLLALADKLSNLRSMAADLRMVGDRLWARFNAPREMQSAYYSLSIDALEGVMDDPNAAWAYWELNGLYKDVFVRFSINDERTCMLQDTLHGESFWLVKHGLQWQPLPDRLEMTPISRGEAEFIEDLWRYT